MSNQGKLFTVTNHSNLGKDWEENLSLIHAEYLDAGLIDVVQSPNAWEFAAKDYFWKAKIRYEKGDRTAARTGNGFYLTRVRSEVDFSGGNGRFSICFDAKSTIEKRFGFDLIEPLQIKHLEKSHKCGAKAGFMIFMKVFDRVFFLPANTISEQYDAWYIGTQIKRRAVSGSASLKIEQLESLGLEVFPVERRNFPKDRKFWDWFPVITKGL